MGEKKQKIWNSADNKTRKNEFIHYSYSAYLEAVTFFFCKKKFFLKISQNSQENTCVGVSYLIKLQVACNFVK